MLAKYDFGTATVPPIASSDTDLNSVASTFTSSASFASGLTPITNVGNPAPSIKIAAGSTPNIQTTTDYFSFTLTPVAIPVNLSRLGFDWAVDGVTGNYAFDAVIGTTTYLIGSINPRTNTSFSNFSFLLNQPQFQT